MIGGVLVAGIGNIFAGDDGFGPEVAGVVAGRRLPPGMRAEDFGIRGLHLAFEALEGWRGLVLIDAIPMGESPGTLVVIEPDTTTVNEAVDAHSMNPEAVLGALAKLGATVEAIRIVGCQPATLLDGIGLSPQVAAAVRPAADLAVAVATELLEHLWEGNRT
jgi:hydrogenase maturation protease